MKHDGKETEATYSIFPSMSVNLQTSDYFCVNITEVGWKARVSPVESHVSEYEFDVLVGADGKRNTLQGTKSNGILLLFPFFLFFLSKFRG